MTSTTTGTERDTAAIADRIRAAYAAMARGDVEPLRQLMTDDVTYVDVSGGITGGVHRGWDSILHLWTQASQVAGGPVRLTLEDVVVPDEKRAVVFIRASADIDGRTVEDASVFVYYLEDGRVRTAYLMHEDPAAPEAFADR
ncbi:nuclear transport factor 2 family protein [Trujillonella endophytica]|uniref:Ketosteroid isomerase-related protein n=1 Tax=Trujillonella endophytica TaxID=673521 RepID=A0A1H8UMA9_9ACTN|nr:nuclear transport factor 2 family protein [Trujillella endophytica]SEP04355.1 Ketosteroid isomerase-related protein [Trujillella endophytica]